METPNRTTSYTLEPENKPALPIDHQIWPPEASNNDAAPRAFSAADPRRTRRRKHARTTCNGGGEEFTDEVERKIEALQGLVPGGERLPVEKLFEETAEYILALERQLERLRFLSALLQSSQKRKRMLGG